MDEATAGNIVKWYENLEEQVVDFLKYVPFHEQNIGTWSPKLATVIVEACGLIDSLLRYVTPSPAIVSGREKNRDDLDIRDYAELYSKKLQLPERKVILLTSPPAYRTPFIVWARVAEGFESPRWWKIYNKLKHSRADHFMEATMEMVIDSLAGSLLIISSLPVLSRAIVRQGWVDLSGANPEFLIDLLASGQAERMVETSLFAVWLGGYPLPEDISKLRPILFGGSTMLAAFFGKL